MDTHIDVTVEVVDPTTAARRLNVNRNTVYRQLREKKIAGKRRFGPESNWQVFLLKVGSSYVSLPYEALEHLLK